MAKAAIDTRPARTLRHWRRVAIATVVVIVLVVVAVVVTGVVIVRRPLPQHDGTVTVPGLGAQVTIKRDERGVPHLYADRAADLFRAQGYVHAQDRFFEMDWRRHVTAGRISELVGADEDALAADKVVRTLGWRRVAQAEFDQADATTKQYLEAYAAGVNDYIRARSPSELSLDHGLLDLTRDLSPIEPWSPVDSVAWFKAMAWDLRGNYDDELARARVFPTVRDLARVEQLYPAYPYDRHAPILPGAGAGSAVTAQRSAALTAPPGSRAVRSAPDDRATRAQKAAARRSAQKAASDIAAGRAFGRELSAADAQRALAQAGRALLAVPDLLGGGDGVGSNSWVVSGRLTATGKPMLANDPHLAPSLPGIWYQVGLHCATVSPACPFEVSGYSFSGVPGVIIGHTDRFAWGLTNLGPDVTDFYLERVTGDRYEIDRQSRPLETRQETIKVAGGDPVTITVRSTGHGPIISDVIPALATAGERAPVGRAGSVVKRDYEVSLAWTALTPGTDMQAIFAVNSATDFASFRKGVLLLDVPAQNFVYADVEGRIGYQAPGRIPIRKGAAPFVPGKDVGSEDPPPGEAKNAGPPVPTDGTWPMPGWLSRFDWDGYVRPAALPSVQDPPEGFIVAANQAVTGPSGPVAFGKDVDYGYRSQRIRDLITARTRGGAKLTLADMTAIQADTFNGIAADLVPLIQKAKVDPFTAQGVATLKGWDFTQPTDSAGAAYFNVFWERLLELTFADEMPVGTRPNGGGRWFEVVRTLLADPQDPWWDDRRTANVVETRDEVIRQAAVQARLRLTQLISKDPGRWSWGHLHRLELRRAPLGSVSSTAPLHWLFNADGWELPGGPSIVNAIGWNAASGSFAVNWAPSMRMVVDLSNLDNSRWVNQTGQSGHPGSGHYEDQLSAWARGETFPWPSSRQAVDAATRSTLVLRPGG